MMADDKWYKNVDNKNIIISSRVRLARNLKDYPFPDKMTEKQKEKVINKVRKAAVDLAEEFEFFKLSDMKPHSKRTLVENLIVKRKHADKRDTSIAVLKKIDHKVTITINGEDHIRIKVITPGRSLNNALEIANKIDNILEKNLDYAFHKKYGYLTTSPTNTGTGLKASYMMHLPILELTGQIKEITVNLGKVGMQLKALYGYATDSYGSIYYLNNALTLGQDENDFIKRVDKLVDKLVDEEEKMRNEILVGDRKLEFEDKIFRAYGTLKYARILKAREAMLLLSDVKLGCEIDLIEKDMLKIPLYKMMIDIKSGNIQNRIGKKLSLLELDTERANYIREQFR